eukprot:CAMPEP_0172763382 /NCGR_PEP_ID=MMETSP1074-20121228/175230_1 /TAXON_ID=2916 /ORGANISM="Ceratium fusus, Strain PA161109" /LENGTH=75 /DNA_ID=CAMNT_0013597945 /DNA_START=7 /DNA_END=230 /DNA_ORIENTATION=-
MKVPVSMGHLEEHWRRRETKRRWERVRTLVMYGMLKTSMLRTKRNDSTATLGAPTENKDEVTDLDYATLLWADGG